VKEEARKLSGQLNILKGGKNDDQKLLGQPKPLDQNRKIDEWRRREESGIKRVSTQSDIHIKGESKNPRQKQPKSQKQYAQGREGWD